MIAALPKAETGGVWGERLGLDWLRRLLGQQNWHGADRRQTLRALCNFEVQVSTNKCSFWGKAIDISEKALRVEVTGAFPSSLRSRQVAWLKHLRPPFGCPRDTLKARVIWVKRIHQGKFQCALAFDDDPAVVRRSWLPELLACALKHAPDQKRRHVRVRMDWLVPALFRNEIHKVRLRDLSMGGARIEINHYIQEGDTLALKVKELKLPCEVRRVTKNGGSYLVGLRLRPEFSQSKQLLQLIKFVCSKG